MNQKKLITILATITIIAILSVSLFVTQFSEATATTYNANNMTVNGVLASDSYVLFPYRKENLIFGFSKYGELINGEAKQGLEYDGMDVFANPNVLEKDWSQGWFIDIHYADLENNYKRAWAFALYSDLSGTSGIGGDWKEGCTAGPLGTPYGGRKTNVWATTDPIKVLYDGPRRFVALTKTTLYDASTKTADDALVSITITFEFNKDKKVVTLFKDIKRLDLGKFGRTFQVEFSNRGEWDIGLTSAPKSYAHFYDNLPTVYDYDYHDFYGAGYPITGFDMCQMIDEDGSYVGFAAFWPQLYGKLVDGTTHIMRSTILSSLCTVTKNETWLSLGSPDNRIINIPGLGWPSSDPFPIGLGATSDAPMVFKNKILLTGGGVDYTWIGGATDTITFTVEPLNTDYITIVYKHEVNPGADDMISHAPVEPDTPYVIGEWCFDLRNEEHKRQFRAVTVYGLTDRNDADDDDADAETWQDVDDNVIDCEVQYYLDETFNPYDLYSAVHKDTKRWVEFYTVKTTDVGKDLYIYLDYAPVLKASVWEEYCSFSEKVLWGGALKIPMRSVYTTYHYELYVLDDGTGYIYIPAAKLPAAGTKIKILYSTYTEYSNWEDIDITWADNIAQAASVSISKNYTYTIIDPLKANHTLYIKELGFTVSNLTAIPANHTYMFIGTMDFYEEDFKVFKDCSTVINCYWWDQSGPHGGRVFRHVADDGTVQVNFTNFWMQWYITPPAEESLHVDWLHLDVDYNITVFYNATSKNYTITTNFNVNGEGGYGLPGTIGTWTNQLYVEHIAGQYEWIVVGKDAGAIDCSGAAYMTEAFDSKKQIHVQVAGSDINATVFGPYAPFVMGRAATGTKADYRDTLGRTFLRDDWCTTYPVSSSNMLFSGGPRAQMGTEYFNEFTNAFFARSEYVTNDTGQANKILALSCWNRTTYGAGYAVISVYKDLNGTIGFLIWGYGGQDTYYAAKWFWEDGIEYLQTENRGVTDIVLKITYPTLDPTHPTFSIVQRLGTISEKTPHDC